MTENILPYGRGIVPRAYAYGDVTATPTVVPAGPGPAEVLSQAMGGSVSLDRYRALLPAVAAALDECQCTTADRAAMWMAQVGTESGGLQWMQELASGWEYEGRADLGNTQPGDGPRFKGRGPIQITGRYNYAALSRWAHGRGLVPSPTFFVDDPAQLASDRYGFLGVIWYWTVERPNINAMCDANNLEGVTYAINGGYHGLDDRRNRWERCRAMGPALLTIKTKPGEISVADAQDIKNAAAGVAANGWPFAWRFAYSRHPRDFNQIINDPQRGPWNRTQPDGTEHPGHTDAYEQIVPINEQIAWTHVFSDGVERDSGDVLLELMEFAIQQRKANNLPTSAFTKANRPPDAFTATIQPAAEPVTKRATRTATKQATRTATKQATRTATKQAARPAKKQAARTAKKQAARTAKEPVR